MTAAPGPLGTYCVGSPGTAAGVTWRPSSLASAAKAAAS